MRRPRPVTSASAAALALEMDLQNAVYIAADNDTAGQRALVRLTERARQALCLPFQ